MFGHPLRRGHRHGWDEGLAPLGAIARGRADQGGWAGFAGAARSGRRRFYDGGELRLLLLKLIEEKPRHGYDLIRAIEERTGGVYVPSPGVIYPTLTMLTDMALIAEQASEGQRKQFEITPAGIAYLAERNAEVAALLARLDAISGDGERMDAPPLRRALHNLRNVLGHRLAAGMEADNIHAAVALIDDVARRIEQL